MSVNGATSANNSTFQLQVSESPKHTTLTSPSGERLEIDRDWLGVIRDVVAGKGQNQIADAIRDQELGQLNEAQFGRLQTAYAEVAQGIEDGSITIESLQQSMISTVRTRAEMLDEIVEVNMSGMEGKNQALADLHAMMQEVRAAGQRISDKKGEKLELSDETWDYIKEQGWDDGNFSDSGKLTKDKAVQFLLDNFKSKVDELSSNSQLEMIQLQGMINKRNQAYELLSTIIKTMTNSTEKAVNNLR